MVKSKPPAGPIELSPGTILVILSSARAADDNSVLFSKNSQISFSSLNDFNQLRFIDPSLSCRCLNHGHISSSQREKITPPPKKCF